ncbi:hypothetical protein ASPACDRAFT_40045 [Aspergillus aculeatus ATCC 16872]|uniref:DUF2470 domain-containing protein n=1 Tax=Aspergillus aculeatus (strain ATCC 16872 / CBS 172.66 / WB 5094) TaxID=690307 RepID=A0A1L9X2M9_ASPA1|nr:uncharacterized protein ASPACDRAFT_40045 [Aspergillus aculeatus ATCC 16872]OJK02730.1 hypothetical protein ASPACDRAFT_40045 [Aspergillus aculeatus ATCC 16872]
MSPLPPQSPTSSSGSSSSSAGKTNNNGIAFTITHMNANHQDSLAYYLRVYNGVSAAEASTATLETITLSDLVLRTNHNHNTGNRYTVALDPPLQSFSETRARLVAMHKECLERLNLSDIKITTYRVPSRPGDILAFLICLSGILAFSRRENLLPGGWVYEGLRLETGWWWPQGFAGFCARMQPAVLAFTLVVHAFEASVLAYTRLRRHGVALGSRVWWAWVLSTLIEGFQGFKRFDRLVREEEAKKK